MKNVINGFWEESFDGFFNSAEFVIGDFQVVNGIEIDSDENNHPACQLVGSWKRGQLPKLIELANRSNTLIFDLTEGVFLNA